MAERRLRRTPDPQRGKRCFKRVRATFDRAAKPINGVDPAKMRDPRLPLYLYLEEGRPPYMDQVFVPDIPA